MKSEIIKGLLAELKRSLSTLYAQRLHGVYLFGSYAREESDEESDVDVLIVLDRVDAYGDEIARTSELIARLSLQYNVSLSRVFASQQQWAEDQTLFFLNVRDEALPA